MALKILALDASTEACSAALSFNNQIIRHYQLAPRQHTQLILPMLQALLDTAGISLSQLDAIAFGRGPGSFTGVRVATSIIKGVAFVHDLPVVPISTLQALAQGAQRNSQANHVISAIDARMNEIYWSAYQIDGNNIMQPIAIETVCAPNEIQFAAVNEALGVGSGWDSYHAIMQSQLKLKKWLPGCFPDAYDIAVLAKYVYQNGGSLSVDKALPVYLRDKVTK